MRKLLLVSALCLVSTIFAVPAFAQVGFCSNVAGKGFVCPSPYTFSKGVQIPVTTIAGLPTCTTALKGLLRTISNGASTPTGGATVSTTGTTVVPVFCDGTNWVYIW